MRSTNGRTTIAAVALLVTAAVIAAFLVATSENRGPREVGLVEGRAARATPSTASASTRVDAPASSVDATVPARELSAPTVSGRFGPALPRDGRTASWTVRVTRGGLPAPATVTLVAGGDVGRRVELGGDGEATLEGLVPGLAIAEIATGAGEVLRRPVRLRHRATVDTDVDFGDHGWLRGVVRAVDGEPVEHARVDVDGTSTTTGADGRFVLPRTVYGPPTVTVSAPGHALHRQRVGRASAGLAHDLDVDVTLRPAARATIRVGASPDGEPMLLVLEASGDPFEVTSGVPEPTYPWAERGVMSVRPGDVVVLDDLPTCRLDAKLIGASHGAETTAWCRPEQPVTLDLEPRAFDDGVDVHVVRSGRPVSGASVHLVVDNPASARARVLDRLVDRLALPLLPAGDVTRTTDVEGTATFARPAERESCHVEVVSGDLTVVRRVAPGDARVVIDLDRPAG